MRVIPDGDTQRPDASARLLTLLSVVISASDEKGCIAATTEYLHLELRLHGIPYEIVVVDDGSRDPTWPILEPAAERISALVAVETPGPNGFGSAIQKGLVSVTGDAVAITIAAEADGCRDVVRSWNRLNEGYDCVFGSHFIKQCGTIDSLWIKWVRHRSANLFNRIVFDICLNDTTNTLRRTATPR